MCSSKPRSTHNLARSTPLNCPPLPLHLQLSTENAPGCPMASHIFSSCWCWQKGIDGCPLSCLQNHVAWHHHHLDSRPFTPLTAAAVAVAVSVPRLAATVGDEVVAAMEQGYGASGLLRGGGRIVVRRWDGDKAGNADAGIERLPAPRG